MKAEKLFETTRALSLKALTDEKARISAVFRYPVGFTLLVTAEDYHALAMMGNELLRNICSESSLVKPTFVLHGVEVVYSSSINESKFLVSVHENE